MNSSELNKVLYRELCKKKDIPLFMQAWWMDAVCVGKEWDVLLYKKKEQITATLVFHHIRKFGIKLIMLPSCTQFNGIWIDYPEKLSIYKKLSLEKETMTYFIEQLDAMKVDYYEQNFAPTITNWLPFYWKGFKQTTRYTYQIKDISDPNVCFEQFSYAKRKQINKAIANKLHLTEDISPELFYLKTKDFLKKKGKDIEFSESFFLTLESAAKQHDSCKIIALEDDASNLHAALFIIWDKQKTYSFISAINPDFNSSGASSLMFWEAIQYASTRTSIFDFEGSMDEGIENSFRQFGAEQVPYFYIFKSNSLKGKLFTALRKWK